MFVVTVIQGGSAVLYAALCVLILLRGRISRTGAFLAFSSAMTSLAAAAAAVPGTILGEHAIALDLIQSLSWYGFVLNLFRTSVPVGDRLGRVFMGLGVLFAALILTGMVTGSIEEPAPPLLSLAIGARMGLALCRLLLIENLYVNTPPAKRWHVALPCVTLGTLSLIDIFLSADVVLQREAAVQILASRAMLTAMVAPLLAVAAARVRSWQVDIHVSREAAFHSASLALAGAFLLGTAALGEATRRYAADWADMVQISFVFVGLIAVGVLLTSHHARLSFRNLVVEHFFSARFDYRREWLRCVETLSRSDNDTTLHARAIRSMADVVGSTSGALFMRESVNAAFDWAGDWNTRSGHAPILPDDPFVASLAGGAWIAEAGAAGPAWPAPLREMPSAWLAIPLAQNGGVIGLVVLAHPPVRFRLDQEVFDLLRMIAREVAAFFAEQRATRLIAQTRELHDYSKRFSFVAHDIKNVSSQLNLLLANAEVHMANPDFQRDMVGTVRASVNRIGSLLRRLEAPDADVSGATSRPAPRLQAILGVYRRRRPDRVFEMETEATDGAVQAMNADAFDTVVTHLLNNAIEASEPGAPILVALRVQPGHVLTEIKDQGAGMSSEFIRDELFSPFRTSKPDGSGIGAFQARELARAAGGDLLVQSTPGKGTTMQLRLIRVGAQDQDRDRLAVLGQAAAE